MQDLIDKLKTLAKFDASIIRTQVERRQAEEAVDARKKEIEGKKLVIAKHEAAYKEKHDLYNKEEKRLRDERVKLEDRKKALETLTNFKLMEAAQKEVSAAEAEIGKEEELILEHIDEADGIKDKLDSLKEEFEAYSKESDTFFDDSKANIESLNEREVDYTKKRDEAREVIDPGSLNLYANAVKKYPTDPVVSVKEKTCQGCFVSLPPVQLSELASSTKLIPCRGCKRILYLESES